MLADPAASGHAFVVLLDNPADALALSQVLARMLDAGGGAAARFLCPPVRGLAFFADAARQPELDAWWASHVPRGAHPVYLVADAEGLEGWLPAVDGSFYIGLHDPARGAAYPGGRVRTFVGTGPLGFVTAIMRDHSQARGGAAPTFDEESLRLGALSSRLTPRPDGATDGAALDTQPLPAISSGQPRPPSPPSSSTLLPWVPAPPLTSASMIPGQGAGSVTMPVAAQGPIGRGRRLTGAGLPGLLGRWRFRSRSDADLGRQLVGRGPTIVVTGSRKGGVGKTSFAAGIAIVAGTALDQSGHLACIVDANIANPDAWGQMSLPAGAATVRDTVAALLGNREPPSPVHAATPALACYPEIREATEYTRTAIRRLADHLRRRYTFIVVDMSNRLPDPTAGPEAAVAAYWLEIADVLVLPTSSARADFNGALDYLEVGDLPATVVAYIVPGSRRLRDNPATLDYLRAIRRRALALVEIPDEANAVRLAGMEGVPVEQLSTRLRLAYRELTEVIAAMPRRSRG